MWQIESVDGRDTVILNSYFTAGWEPFAVSTRMEPWLTEVIWLRRKK